jgi:cytochrome c oxidase cbb3-type subunit I
LAVLGVTSVLLAISALRSVDYAVHFTLFDVGVRTLLLKGSATMVLFGAIYYIMPRLSGCEWLSSSLISLHFLGSAYGSCMGAAMLILSGVASGSALVDGDSTFSQVIELGSSYFWGHTLSFVLLLGGYFLFTMHFLLMAARIGQPAGEATLLQSHNEH